jgi:hypothetical protein
MNEQGGQGNSVDLKEKKGQKIRQKIEQRMIQENPQYSDPV